MGTVLYFISFFTQILSLSLSSKEVLASYLMNKYCLARFSFEVHVANTVKYVQLTA